jgi:hypothetical protein
MAEYVPCVAGVWQLSCVLPISPTAVHHFNPLWPMSGNCPAGGKYGQDRVMGIIFVASVNKLMNTETFSLSAWYRAFPVRVCSFPSAQQA